MEASSFDLSLLWLWPVLLFQALLETFAHHTTRLKALRKADPRYSEQDWLVHVENLRITEWEVRAYLSGHALKLMAGKAIDPSDGLVPLAPPGWTRPEPRSARELILRFEAITRIYANPMRHIERYARRLAKAKPECAPASGVDPATTIFRAAGWTTTIFSHGALDATTTILLSRPDDDDSHSGVCIRGPPWRLHSKKRKPIPTRSCLRERDRTPKTQKAR